MTDARDTVSKFLCGRVCKADVRKDKNSKKQDLLRNLLI